jgi:hypothetical protein
MLMPQLTGFVTAIIEQKLRTIFAIQAKVLERFIPASGLNNTPVKSPGDTGMLYLWHEPSRTFC